MMSADLDWCVDSLRFSSSEVIGSTQDHKPSDSKERDRIEKAGGFVTQGTPARLDGVLSLSRAFGDFQYKQVSTFQFFEKIILRFAFIALFFFLLWYLCVCALAQTPSRT